MVMFKILEELSENDIYFIRHLAEKKFKTTNCNFDFEKRKQLESICKKFDVTSFEQILRKIIFYNLFEINLEEDYLEYVENYSKERVGVINEVRSLMLGLAKNVPDYFSELSYNFTNTEIPSYQKSIKYNQEMNYLLETLESIIRMVNLRHNFNDIFNSIFNLIDEEYTHESEKIIDLFDNYNVKYLYIVRIFIENAFSAIKNRHLTQEENELLNYLLYEGDEIDYMKKYRVSSEKFETVLESIINTYNVKNLQEMLIIANIEKTMFENSSIYNLSFIKLKLEYLMANWDGIIKSASKDKLQTLEHLKYEIDECAKNRIFSNDFYHEFNSKIIDDSDSIFFTKNKMQLLKEWFNINITDLNTVQEMGILLNQISELSCVD